MFTIMNGRKTAVIAGLLSLLVMLEGRYSLAASLPDGTGEASTIGATDEAPIASPAVLSAGLPARLTLGARGRTHINAARTGGFAIGIQPSHSVLSRLSGGRSVPLPASHPVILKLRI
jgi:hypothetical protein